MFGCSASGMNPTDLSVRSHNGPLPRSLNHLGQGQAFGRGGPRYDFSLVTRDIRVVVSAKGQKGQGSPECYGCRELLDVPRFPDDWIRDWIR